MSKAHSGGGDAWMKLIGIGDHNVKRSKGKTKPAEINGYDQVCYNFERNEIGNDSNYERFEK